MSAKPSPGGQLAATAFGLVVVLALFGDPLNWSLLPVPPLDLSPPTGLVAPPPGEQARAALARGERLKTARELYGEAVLREFPDIHSYLDDWGRAVVFQWMPGLQNQDELAEQYVLIAREKKRQGVRPLAAGPSVKPPNE